MLRLLFVIFLLAGPAAARQVTDHAGHSVAVPEAPQRIVSLHDWTTTVMLHELGAPLAGSSYRFGLDGRYFMRGAEDLFGIGPDEVPLASVHGQVDPERIAALQPDLIIGNVGDIAALRDQLSGIAPVLLFDAETARDPLARYRELAAWVGREEAFEALLARLGPANSATGCSWAVLNASTGDGTLTLARDFGAVSLALEHLGLQRDAAMQFIPEGADRAVLSAEIAGAILPDVLLTTYLQSNGETADSSRAALATVAPGYDHLLAAAGTAVIAVSRERYYPISVTGIGELLHALPIAMPERCRAGRQK